METKSNKRTKFFSLLVFFAMLSVVSCDIAVEDLNSDQEQIGSDQGANILGRADCDSPGTGGAWVLYNGINVVETLQAILYNDLNNITSVENIDVGYYKVTFPGLAIFNNGGSAIHTTSFGGDHIVQVSSWDTTGDDLHVYIRCFDSSGSPINDVGFTTLVYKRDENNLANGAYLWNNSSCFTYNRKGQGDNSMIRMSKGVYEVKFPGIEAPNDIQGNLQVTPYGDEARYCQIASVTQDVSGVKAIVNTYDANGELADTVFTISHFSEFILASSPFPPVHHFAYLRFDEAIDTKNFQVNFPSNNSIDVLKLGPGHYCAEIPNNFRSGEYIKPMPIVTALGSDGSHPYISKIRLGRTGIIIHIKFKMPNGVAMPENPKFNLFLQTAARSEL